MDPLPPRHLSLLHFAEVEIGGALWSEYMTVRRVGREALRKSTVLDQPLQDLTQVPYDDPVQATRFWRRQWLERQFLEELSARALAGDWHIEGREEGSVEFVLLDARLLAEPSIDFEDNSITVDGRRFRDICLRPGGPDPAAAIVRLIQALEPRFNPKFDRIQDLKSAVEEVFGRKLPLAYFKKLMGQAGASPDWSGRGRKQGSPSYPEKNQ